MRSIYLSMLLCLYGLTSSAVVQTNVIHFSPSDYHAAGQNWSIIEWNEHIYCANHDALLRYNGNDWDNLSAMEQLDVKVVHVYNERLYVAGENTIGYWSFDPYKSPIYHSLYEKIQNIGVTDVAFWSIAHSDSIIYFQSFSHIVGFMGDSCFSVVSEDCYSNIYPCGQCIYTQKLHGDIYNITQDTLSLYYSNSLLHTLDVQFCITDNRNKLFIGLSNGSIYRVVKDDWTLLCNVGNDLQFSSACFIDDAVMAFGTRGNGIYFVNTETGYLYNIAQNQMHDMNVHHICYKDAVLWAALDNGIAQISLNSGWNMLFSSRDIGVLVSAVSYNNIDWVATNRGLYTLPSFTKVPVSGLPLYLYVFNNQLFCGTTEKLFLLDSRGVQNEWPINGVQQAEAVLYGDNTVLVLRSYAGLGIMHTNNGSMNYHDILETRDCQMMMPESIRYIWVIQNTGQLLRLHLNQDLTRIESSIDFAGHSIRPVSMAKVDNQLLFVCSDGIYTYQTSDSTFVRTDIYWENMELVKIVVKQNDNDLWVAAGDFLYLYRVEDMHSVLLRKYTLCGNPLLQYNKTYAVFPEYDRILLGTGEGAIRLNTRDAYSAETNTPRIEYCSYILKDQKHYATIKGNRIVIPANASDISIVCASGITPYRAYVSYLLTPLLKQWSPWKASGHIAFSSLPTGTYHLSVRGACGPYSTDVHTIDIVSQPPFYASSWAILLYSFIAVLIIFLVQRLILRHKTRKLQEQNKADREKQEALLNAEKAKVLAVKVESQEAELQSNLRLLTQKQEIIDAIAKELNKIEKANTSAREGYLRLLRIVQSKSNKQSGVFSLENYFADVQKDFISRIHPLFPDLTQAEIRLCCMIRSNLLTKEIAAIFGIAPRSVELKKYRLKKHLGLSPESDLTSYLMSI